MTYKSVHKSYIEGFQGTKKDFVNKVIFPYKKDIFYIFSQRLALDADKDLRRDRNKLSNLGFQAEQICKKIHTILSEDEAIHLHIVKELTPEVEVFANSFLDMDYNSISISFGYMQKKLLKNRYIKSGFLTTKLQQNFEAMRNISEEHTKITDW